MAQKAPGKSDRQGISLMELGEMFPDEAAAILWFEMVRWPDGRHCGHCGSVETKAVPNAKPMPFWCKDCRSYFSVRTGTAIEKSRLPLRKWVFAIYLNVTSLKSVSSLKLHRDLKVTQKTAWFMQHRLREAWVGQSGTPFDGPVEVDETKIGGKFKNMHAHKRHEARQKPDLGKATVAGIRDRETARVVARVVPNAKRPTLRRLLMDHVSPAAMVYHDDAKAYARIPFEHESVNHSAGEYVRGRAHTNGIESFWSMFKRAYHGTFHYISPKHLQRYVAEFASKNNIRNRDTIDQMNAIVAGMVGRRLLYRDLVSD